MVRASAADRRSHLSRCLRAFVWLGAVLWVIALSAPLESRADAETFFPPSEHWLEPELPEWAACPEGVEEAQEPPAEGEEASLAARQVTLLRGELQQSCKAQAGRLQEVVRRLWWVTVEQAEVEKGAVKAAEETNEFLAAILEQVTNKGEASNEDLHQLRGLFEDAFVDTGSHTLRHLLLGGSEEGDPLPVSGIEGTSSGDRLLRQAVVDGTQTNNQNMWGLAGLAVGFLALFGLFKLVRP